MDPLLDDVSFFKALQAALNKQSSTNRKTPEQIDAAIRQLVSKAILNSASKANCYQ